MHRLDRSRTYLLDELGQYAINTIHHADDLLGPCQTCTSIANSGYRTVYLKVPSVERVILLLGFQLDLPGLCREATWSYQKRRRFTWNKVFIKSKHSYTSLAHLHQWRPCAHLATHYLAKRDWLLLYLPADVLLALTGGTRGPMDRLCGWSTSCASVHPGTAARTDSDG